MTVKDYLNGGKTSCFTLLEIMTTKVVLYENALSRLIIRFTSSSVIAWWQGMESSLAWMRSVLGSKLWPSEL